MADNSRGGATPFLAFLVGGLMVAAAVIGVAMYGGFTPPSKPVDVKVSIPHIPTPSIPNPAPPPAPVPTPG